MRWKTKEIKKLIQDALEALPIKPARILVLKEGGDYDSELIQIQYTKLEFLNVCGFDTEKSNNEDGNTPSDMEVEMIEVKDGQDSRGGLNSDNEGVCMAYGVLCGALRRNGFDVVPQMKDYF